MKLIYQPKGKAQEYAPWAVNFYNGCSNRCDYCYNRHCQAKALLGKDEPTLKSGLTENDAINLFTKEMVSKLDILRNDGLFFNFVSDPCLPETIYVNWNCIAVCLANQVPVKVLTKRADWLDTHPIYGMLEYIRMNHSDIKIGFSLTGMDVLEPGASTNEERIIAMERLSAEFGIKTWASIEPVIRTEQSFIIMHKAYKAGCREFRIGLLSGKKQYTKDDIESFVDEVDTTFGNSCEIHWKQSVKDFIGI